jgi:hypothetical protein
MHVSPLWLDHPYPAIFGDNAGRSVSFHVANGSHLIMDNGWCATNIDAPWESLPVIFKPKERHPASAGFSPYAPMPEHLQVPSFIRKSHLQNAIRLHEAEVEYHKSRCALYLKILTDIDTDNAS